MITLRLVGWNPGLQTVSLVRAMRDHSESSLAESRELLEELLGGRTITLKFRDAEGRDLFKRRAEELGAIAG